MSVRRAAGRHMHCSLTFGVELERNTEPGTASKSGSLVPHLFNGFASHSFIGRKIICTADHMYTICDGDGEIGGSLQASSLPFRQRSTGVPPAVRRTYVPAPFSNTGPASNVGK